MTTPCPGDAAVRAHWTARSLAGAFLDLTLAWACLCLAALFAVAARLLSLLGLPLPCTCARPHLPCLLAFLACYPSRAVGSLHAALRARFPFAGPTDGEDHRQEGAEEEGEEQAAVDAWKEEADLCRREEARAELQRELEKERSASASATEEAMSMILRLQKEKSALEIEARQQRRTADERCAFYEDEVEELRDIVLVREREARALRKEVDAYRRLLGLGAAEDDEEEDDEQEMVTPHSFLMSEGEPSSSKSVDANRMQHFGNDSSGFSFKTPSLREQPMVPPLAAGRINVGSDDSVSVQTPAKVPTPQSRLKLDSFEDDEDEDDDGAETVEILPLSARSQDLDQGGDFHVDAAPGMESTCTKDTCTKEQAAHAFQEVECPGIDKIVNDQTGSKNDANVYDVHVVDDIRFSTEVKGLIGRSISEATMQAERLQTRAAADDLLGKSLNAIKGAQDKIRHAANERRQSLQLQLLEDIANQLQGIKDAAEAGRRVYCASPKISKRS
ncbi:unnamed protein product [Miscanthus lutarioriparius]|uniref:GTD-binding domain-containing protein n=1 Tax=Miscanthus lutarioriparius TaxID=422564 RepID=A0A811SGZ0_9POAL|nr:unnamed protein product [Miscanthus lutarioriparius]